MLGAFLFLALFVSTIWWFVGNEPVMARRQIPRKPNKRREARGQPIIEYERNEAVYRPLQPIVVAPSSFDNRGWNPRASFAVPATPSKNQPIPEALAAVVINMEQIGEGSSCRVYSGTTTGTRQSVAVKIFTRDMMKKRDQEWKMRQDIAKHPSLVDFLFPAGPNAIIMELCPGGKLSTFTTRNVKKDPNWHRQVAEMLRSISAGLAHIHNSKYVYLDVKPDNILVSEGKFKLVDFGKMKSMQTLRFPTKKNLWYGDVRYVAPEVYRQDPDILWDGREDVYSLGIVAAEMMYDISPTASAEKEIPQQLHYNVDHPRALCGVVVEMLAANAPSRPLASAIPSKLRF